MVIDLNMCIYFTVTQNQWQWVKLKKTGDKTCKMRPTKEKYDSSDKSEKIWIMPRHLGRLITLLKPVSFDQYLRTFLDDE